MPLNPKSLPNSGQAFSSLSDLNNLLFLTVVLIDLGVYCNSIWYAHLLRLVIHCQVYRVDNLLNVALVVGREGNDLSKGARELDGIKVITLQKGLQQQQAKTRQPNNEA